MFIIYNILQCAFLLVFSPLIILFIVCSRKYRDGIPARLGKDLTKSLACRRNGSLTFWIHALSVGEVTSALPLVRALREKYPAERIVLSVTTRTGKKVAESLLATTVDCIIDSPIDFLPTIRHFIKHIRPDIFVVVETDLWPNILLSMQRQQIPSILVNGRISEKSMRRYTQFGCFFRPMFQCFSLLSMQTIRDKQRMEVLGIPSEKLPILGNLKFATRRANDSALAALHASLLPKNRLLFIAGSTHPGEELILFDSYCRLRNKHPELVLLLAPRNPNRAKEIAALATSRGLHVTLRSTEMYQPSDLFIIDTLGELVDFYALADVAFVGGSLVDKGGHNPVEPASMAIPVLFGRHMEDFSEIAASLIQAGGAIEIKDSEGMSEVLSTLLEDSEYRLQMGKAAQLSVLGHQDIVLRHLTLIDTLL